MCVFYKIQTSPAIQAQSVPMNTFVSQHGIKRNNCHSFIWETSECSPTPQIACRPGRVSRAAWLTRSPGGSRNAAAGARPVCLVAWLPAGLPRAGRLREKSSTLVLLFVFFVCVSVKVKIPFQCFSVSEDTSAGLSRTRSGVKGAAGKQGHLAMAVGSAGRPFPPVAWRPGALRPVGLLKPQCPQAAVQGHFAGSQEGARSSA